MMAEMCQLWFDVVVVLFGAGILRCKYEEGAKS